MAVFTSAYTSVHDSAEEILITVPRQIIASPIVMRKQNVVKELRSQAQVVRWTSAVDLLVTAEPLQNSVQQQDLMSVRVIANSQARQDEVGRTFGNWSLGKRRDLAPADKKSDINIKQIPGSLANHKKRLYAVFF